MEELFYPGGILMTNQHGKNFVAANWKMNLLASASARLAAEFKEAAAGLKKTEVWVAASPCAIPAVADVLRDSPVRYGGQNVFAPEGAYTGEVSISMYREFGCTFSIIGHSERRHVFGETDTLVVKRTVVSLQNQFEAIFCIGETLEEREAGNTKAVLERQLRPLIENIRELDQSLLLVAYEPVWAIGTGKVATLEEIETAHDFIETFWKSTSGKTCPPVLYGGSVTPDNFGPIIGLKSVAGALVGGASLSTEKFARLIQISEAGS